jgi:hypothetical protein
VKKGALVELISGLGNAVPNVVIFQFNPETMHHSWSQGMGEGGGAAGARGDCSAASGSSPLAVSGPPSESFSFTLSMDVTDHISASDPIARDANARNGLYPRLAALELFLHPAPLTDLLSSSGSARTTPAARLPVVLFVWGSTRIVPVRVTSLSITEKLYDADLNPTHADAQIELRVLTSDDLRSVTGAAGALATAAYKYSAGARVALAATNLGTAARDVIGMITEKLVP